MRPINKHRSSKGVPRGYGEQGSLQFLLMGTWENEQIFQGTWEQIGLWRAI